MSIARASGFYKAPQNVTNFRDTFIDFFELIQSFMTTVHVVKVVRLLKGIVTIIVELLTSIQS